MSFGIVVASGAGPRSNLCDKEPPPFAGGVAPDGSITSCVPGAVGGRPASPANATSIRPARSSRDSLDTPFRPRRAAQSSNCFLEAFAKRSPGEDAPSLPSRPIKARISDTRLSAAGEDSGMWSKLAQEDTLGFGKRRVKMLSIGGLRISLIPDRREPPSMHSYKSQSQ